MNLKESRLLQVAAQARPLFTQFHTTAKERGFNLLIVRAWSSLAEQQRIYELGRVQDAAGAWVVDDVRAIRSKAKPGETPHNVCMADGAPASLAIDVIPLDLHGVPLWAMPGEKPRDLEVRWVKTYDLKEMEVWAELYEMAVQMGLDPLGDKRDAYLAWDKAHFEVLHWKARLQEWGLLLPAMMPVHV